MSVTFHQNARRSQAKSKVFNTPELLEMVLLALPETNIIANAMRTCRGFKTAIESSVQLKRQIWRLPKTDVYDPGLVTPAGTITTNYVLVVPRDLSERGELGRFAKVVEGGLKRHVILNSLVFNPQGGLQQYHYYEGELHFQTERLVEDASGTPSFVYNCWWTNRFKMELPALPSLGCQASLAAMQMFDPPQTRTSIRYKSKQLPDLESVDGVTVADFFHAVRAADCESWTDQPHADTDGSHAPLVVSTSGSITCTFQEALSKTDIHNLESVIYSED